MAIEQIPSSEAATKIAPSEHPPTAETQRDPAAQARGGGREQFLNEVHNANE